MLLFFGLLYAILSATPYAGAADEGALVLDIGGSIVEQPADADPLELISGASVIREYRLRDIVHALETAAKDNRVKAVALDLDVFVGGGPAALSPVGEPSGAPRVGKTCVSTGRFRWSQYPEKK